MIRRNYIGPGLGERCDGGSDEEEEEDTTGRSRSYSTGTKRRKSNVRETIVGAIERLAFGRLDQVEVQCQDGLFCVEMEEERRTCQEENRDGEKPVPMANVHSSQFHAPM
jgi:hypothetical protein